MPAYHYTSSWHLPWILASGALVQSQQRIADFPSPDFVWATTSPRGDITATVRDGYRLGIVKLVRLTFEETEFFPWAEVQGRYPEWTSQHVAALERAAQPQDIRGWLCRASDLPVSLAKAIDVRTYTNNTWRPVTDLEVRQATNSDGSEWRVMRLLGQVEASSRKVRRDGGFEFHGGAPALPFDKLPLAT
ncbi:hypothetical protein P6U16_08655 [Rhizobium sp. 32-5/1]|uniref:hypothetical protein n=1 Tax=Rhizobium sp. 32-5/1 TaxID=3019602 RepID=UPI00240DE763|nr:hypothetical protein [Rhizobium sp. 32-5/1]WEZ84625.1 hypothetical protein P6U16_08655 [Rhizobium sp. 32-5/1]